MSRPKGWVVLAYGWNSYEIERGLMTRRHVNAMRAYYRALGLKIWVRRAGR